MLNIHKNKIIRSKDFQEITIDKTRIEKKNIKQLNQLKSLDEKMKITGNLENYFILKFPLMHSERAGNL